MSFFNDSYKSFLGSLSYKIISPLTSIRKNLRRRTTLIKLSFQFNVSKLINGKVIKKIQQHSLLSQVFHPWLKIELLSLPIYSESELEDLLKLRIGKESQKLILSILVQLYKERFLHLISKKSK